MSQAVQEAAEPRTFGNWSRPRSPGLPGLGLVGTVVFFAGTVLVVVVQLAAGFLAAGVTLLLVAAVLAPIAYRNRSGRNGWQIAVTRIAWWRGKRRHRRHYAAALTTPTAFGAARLPGLLARSEVWAAQTGHGDHFALISIPATRHYAVVLRCEPEGAALVDPETVDTWVAMFGRFLAELSHEPALVACSVTIETAPDPGTRLAAEVDTLTTPGAPELARAMLEEAATRMPRGSASVHAWVTLTFTATRRQVTEREGLLRRRPTPVPADAPVDAPAVAAERTVIDVAGFERGDHPLGHSGQHTSGHDSGAGDLLGGQRSMLPRPKVAPRGVRAVTEMAAQVGDRLPGLMAALRATGAGTVTPMTPTQVAERVRVAFDPASARAVEESHTAPGGSGITWADAGPSSAVESWGAYRHDSGSSITWQMVGAPAGAVQSTVLERLLAPTDALTRKRVTLLYRPHDPATAAAIADRDVRTAIDHATSRRGEARAGDSVALAAARQSAREQASGAGLVRFAVLVTATVDDPARLPAAAETIDQLGGASRLRLRRCYGSQAAAFSAALGVGIVLPSHVLIPSVLRDNL